MEQLNKTLLKKYLQVFDTIEIRTMDAAEMAQALVFECARHEIEVNSDLIQLLLVNLFESNNLIQLDEGIEISQSVSIFSRSKDSSITEALALIESSMQKREVRLFIANHLQSTFVLNELKQIMSPLLFACLLQSQCFITNEKEAQFHPQLRSDIDWILHQKDNVCSDCLKAHYTKDLYASRQLEYRNLDVAMIDYQNKKRILELLPQKGIPDSRDETKELQIFFKDCLFNEFQHRCCICGVAIPQMLIASHIKPFRDCGHLLEAMDANNGLLLCRNHDYLFDQGYFSFNEQGELLLSKELIGKEKIYNMNPQFQLDKKHLTHSRICFLDYHRHNISRK